VSVNSGVVELCGSGSPGSEEATAAASLAAAGVDVLFFFRHGRSFANEGCFTRKCRARLDVEPPEYEYSFPQVSHLALFVFPATWEKCIQMELRFERSVAYYQPSSLSSAYVKLSILQLITGLYAR